MAENRPADGNANPSEYEQLAALVGHFIGLMRAGSIAQLDLERGDLKLSLRAQETATVAIPQGMMFAAPSAAPPPAAASATPAEAGFIVKAPMIGTFYAAAGPNEQPFVQVGDRVEAGQTVGIIEAMKIMNEIASDQAGVVAEIIANNGQPVEYGSPLIRLQPDPA